ncbi:MAG: phytanoyl-CoA dioxygenase family protein [Planctomycetota bacterium]
MTTATLSNPNVPVWSVDPREARLSAQEQDYLFDLRGFRVIQNALSDDQLRRINDFIDAHPADQLKSGEWIGNVETHSYGSEKTPDGLNFQNIIEGGEVFEELIDQPAWLDQVRGYIETDSHRLAIDENFLNIRRTGGFIPIHSGGAHVRFTSCFRNAAGKWAVGQINVLMALTDTREGDGCTTVVPGSHKSHEDHPQIERAWDDDHPISGGDAVGMVQVHLNAGDVLMFTDAITHGSLPRTNPGERRVCIYRYAPHLLAKRMNYLPDPAFMQKLTPPRRALVMPTPPRMRPGRVLRAEDFAHDTVGG